MYPNGAGMTNVGISTLPKLTYGYYGIGGNCFGPTEKYGYGMFAELENSVRLWLGAEPLVDGNGSVLNCCFMRAWKVNLIRSRFSPTFMDAIPLIVEDIEGTIRR